MFAASSRAAALLPMLLASLSLLSFAACSDDERRATDDGVAPRTDAGAPTNEVCPPDNPYCKAPATKPETPLCESLPIDLEPVGVNVMIAVDGSAPMAAHWPQVRSAVAALREAHPEAAFGLQMFWGELVDWDTGFEKNNWCGATESRILEVGDHRAQAMLDFMGDAPPGPSFVGGLFATSPVIEPLNHYLRSASKLADPSRTNYLVFVTSGNDNCFGSVFTSRADKLLAYEKLAVELGKSGIRVLPVGFAAANGGASGSGLPGATPAGADYEVLEKLLEHGGTGLTEVPEVDDPARLGDVLAQVGKTVRNCRFAIPSVLDPSAALNPFELTFTINGNTVARDRTRSDGWNFVDGDTSQVELFGKACQAVRARAPLAAHKSCSDQVCGTAALRVETKPRAVLHLLDASASSIACTDDGWGCLQTPDSPTRTALSYWEVMEHAIGKSLVAPVNDDIEFGLKLFPSKNTGNFSCEALTDPEVSIAQGTEITIMSKMLETLPFGSTPLLHALEHVADAPGRLAEAEVEGAVVILTDGSDTCAGVAFEELLARLASAARRLREAGVNTYVVRFGPASARSPEQESQLRTIVANGGTAQTDPSDPNAVPYIDATDQRGLDDALARISGALAACSVELDDPPSGADADKLNIYLNGEVIPRDAQGKKREGWGWADDAKRKIDMYGRACDGFKNNRRTSFVIEYGCASVTVI
ncbi:MAG: vWA domain-containing protein [Polyangiales bacterium]